MTSKNVDQIELYLLRQNSYFQKFDMCIHYYLIGEKTKDEIMDKN